MRVWGPRRRERPSINPRVVKYEAGRQMLAGPRSTVFRGRPLGREYRKASKREAKFEMCPGTASVRETPLAVGEA